jgi:uncharacterized membrane protein HdeD (DUF308 family)
MWSRLLRWSLLVGGGALLGAGLVLLGQLVFAEHMRAQAQNTFFLWRGIGQLSFIFQDDQTKLALWLNEIDGKILDHSRHAACVLLVLGGLVVLLAPWMHCGKRKAQRARGT